MEPALSKAAVRHAVRQSLQELPVRQRAQEEGLVCARIEASPAWGRARMVALYHARAPELSVAALANAAWREGRRVCFPRVEADQLVFYEVGSWSAFERGAFGIMEPRHGLPPEPVDPEEVDLWIVPGVAFDRDGGRIGQGGGFYDRVLPQRRSGAPTWGAAFGVQVLDRLPLEPHDVRMDAVATPDGIHTHT